MTSASSNDNSSAPPPARPGRILESINDPADLRRLGIPELEQLAAEIRDYIAETAMVRGGHFGSSFGAVELILALHKVYLTPRDKIVFDVGHQAYAHKIITGRREWFKTLRSQGGISGFLKRNESIYDVFGAGHASTSISAAVGFAVARDMLGSDEKVVAVIGDGSMTGGLAYEGLNNAGFLKKDILVIVNDNNMSISGNVGALSHHFTKMLTSPRYHQVKDDIEDLLAQIHERTRMERRFPFISKMGHVVLEKAVKMKEGVKNLLLPSLFFEELGFTYYGPVNGHDIGKLISVLTDIRRLHGPILLHVCSEKGKGSEWAENHPERGHAAIPGFDPRDGRRLSDLPEISAKKTWTAVFADELIALADRDKRIAALTAAMPSGTGLSKFKEKHPARFLDVGIAEGHAVVSAAGMACGGMRPVVAIYSTFLQRAFDNIIHDVCIQNLPVFFALDRGGIVGDDGETHQGVYDIGYLRMIPNMRVLLPKDSAELAAMMKMGVEWGGPSALRFPRGACVMADRLSTPIEWGKAEILREGTDLWVLGFGPLVAECLAAAEAAKGGRSIGVANMRFAKPIDEEMIVRAAQSGRIVTVEEGSLMTGAGSAVLEILADRGIDCRVKRLGVPDRFIEHGEPKAMRAAIGLSIQGIAAAIDELMG